MNDAIGRLWNRLRQLVGRGRTTQVDDSKGAQVHQVRMGADELRDGAPRVGEYGLASNPPPGTDAIMVFIGGDRSNGVIIATNSQTLRMRNLASGETAIYDDKGRFVLLGAAGIHVQGKDDPVLVETTSTLTATVGGDVTVTSTGGAVNVTAATTIKLVAETIQMQASTVEIQAATQVTGTMGVEGITTLVGDTSITGALTNNGHNAGDGHEHLPGTFKVGSSAVTGISGVVTP